MTNDEIAERVSDRIDQSIRENVRREILITVILVIQVGVGVGLLIYGVRAGGFIPLMAGTTCQAATGWPIAKLITMRRDNLYLKILPALLRMADTKDQKRLLYEFAKKLMAKL